MARYNAIDAQTMDNIVMLREKGITIEQTSVFCKCAHATTQRVWQAYKAAQEKNYDVLREIDRRGSNITEWVCAKFGIDASDIRLTKPEKKPEPEISEAPKQTAPEKPDNTALAFVQLAEGIRALTAAVDAIDKRLSVMQLTQQGFRGDMNECVKKLVETINVNGDILTKEHERMIDLLGGIKCNTRKRGSNDAM